MPRDSSGTYTAPVNSWNPPVDGTFIDPSDWEAQLADYETAFTDSLSRSGEGGMLADLEVDDNAILMSEISAPSAPAANGIYLYAFDVSGATRLATKDSSSNVAYISALPSALTISRAQLTSTGVNFNAGNTDTVIPVVLPPGFTRFAVILCKISGASGSLTTATAGLFTAAAGGGVAVVTGASAITVSTASENTLNNSMNFTVNNQLTQSYAVASVPNLYFRVANPQGTAATGTVTIELQLIP